MTCTAWTGALSSVTALQAVLSRSTLVSTLLAAQGSRAALQAGTMRHATAQSCQGLLQTMSDWQHPWISPTWLVCE